jgi:hypothetical protein
MKKKQFAMITMVLNGKIYIYIYISNFDNFSSVFDIVFGLFDYNYTQ